MRSSGVAQTLVALVVVAVCDELGVAEDADAVGGLVAVDAHDKTGDTSELVCEKSAAGSADTLDPRTAKAKPDRGQCRP